MFCASQVVRKNIHSVLNRILILRDPAAFRIVKLQSHPHVAYLPEFRSESFSGLVDRPVPRRRQIAVVAKDDLNFISINSKTLTCITARLARFDSLCYFAQALGDFVEISSSRLTLLTLGLTQPSC